MKTLDLKIDLEGVNLGDALKDKQPVEIVADTIKDMLYAYATQERGLTGEDRRKIYKINDALDAVVKSTNGGSPCEVQLDDDWMGFLKKCKRDGKFLPNKLLQKVENLIDAVENR